MSVDISKLRLATEREAFGRFSGFSGKAGKTTTASGLLKSSTRPPKEDSTRMAVPEHGMFKINSGISPAKLYIYLKAKYGAPNGFMNALKKDDSANIFHWHYALMYNGHVIELLGLTYRVEVWARLEDINDEKEALEFLASLIRDSSKIQKECADVSGALEKWDQVINPFHRIHNLVIDTRSRLERMKLGAVKYPDRPKSETEVAKFQRESSKIGRKITRAYRLCYSLRSMCPVYVESLVNLLFFIMKKEEYRKDPRLNDHFVRSNIDVKIKTMHMACYGFSIAIDWEHEVCKEYNGLVNRRNNMLHGNFDVKSLSYSKVLFDGKTPIYPEFPSIETEILKIALHEIGHEEALGDVQICHDFIEYLLSCIGDPNLQMIRSLIGRSTLGYRDETKRIGVLFPEHMVDMMSFLK